MQAELAQQYPKTDKDWSAQVTDLKTTRVGQYREPLIFVLGSVALLLAIALANTAGLMLTQLQRRETELAIRGFLGATRMQVVAGIVQEILIVAAVAIAVAVAVGRRAAARRFGGVGSAAAHVRIDDELACIHRRLAVRRERRACVRRDSRVARDPTRHRRYAITHGSRYLVEPHSQRVLVAGQIAIATLLLSSTGLMLRSYYNLAHVDSGFDASHTATFHVGAAWDEDRVAVGQMQQQLLDALRSIPGVTTVGFSNFLPASNATIRYQVRLQESHAPSSRSDRDTLTVGERSVTRDYFQALGARVVAGTTCPDLPSIRSSTPKALVNRRFVTSYASGANVVGRYAAGVQGLEGPPMEIVGVVDDIREDNLRTSAVPYSVYVHRGRQLA